MEHICHTLYFCIALISLFFICIYWIVFSFWDIAHKLVLVKHNIIIYNTWKLCYIIAALYMI